LIHFLRNVNGILSRLQILDKVLSHPICTYSNCVQIIPNKVNCSNLVETVKYNKFRRLSPGVM
jgi:hypothetical protein